MRFLIISDCYYPTTKSISRHIYDLLKEASIKGTVIDFYFPYNGNKKNIFKKSYLIKNINYFPIKTTNFKKKNLLLRGLSEFLMPFIFWSYIKKNNNHFNKILIFSPSIFFGLIIKKLKKKFKCIVILILRDIFPDWILQKQIIQWLNPLFLLAKVISFFQYYLSDIIAVQSYGDKEIIKKRYPNKNIKVIYNWISPKKFKIRKKNNITNFVFAGTIGPAQNWYNIIDLITKLNKEKLEFKFFFVGDGRYKFFLKKKLIDFKNVYFKRSLQEKKFLKFLKGMDVGIISLDHKIKFNNIPGKFFSYLEVNLPILLDANYKQEVSKIIKHYNIGLTNRNINNDLFKNAKILIEKKINHQEIKKNYKLLLREKFSTKIAYKKIFD